MDLNSVSKKLLDRELNRFIDIGEAAELLGISRTTLRRYTNSGKLAVFRVGPGRHRRFRKGDLLQFLEGENEAAE